MRIEQLDYIVEVAKLGSISGAAEKLHVTTATISQSISKFENKFGVILFKRSRLGTVPTAKGKIIIEKAYEIKTKLLELEKEASSQNSQIDRKLILVSSPSVLKTLLPKAVSLFSKEYPNVDINITENQNVIEEMLNHDSDIGFIAVDENTWFQHGNMYKHILHFDTLLQGRMYVCVHKDSPLSFKESLTPEELLNQTLVMHTITKPIYDDIEQQYGTIKILFESPNTETIKIAVREGIGFTFFSDFSIRNDPWVASGDIVAIPLVNYERSNLTLGCVHSKKRRFSEEARDFLIMMRQLIANDAY